MIAAYVLISVKSAESRVARDLLKIEEVKNIHLIEDGDYNIIAYVETENLIDLKEMAMEKIAQVKDVRKTTTLIIAEEISNSKEF